ncbi:DNA polymerase eta-like [Pistacia vera]|uniref:DNA polymerase eta-like n=1 Tax=Pistacia vera TaxID=55513 RepID=UPI0012634184|nr:DNA polymerase eta-like [Pistacia vera]
METEQNKRIARTLTLHVSAFRSSDTDSLKKFPSKSCPLRYGTAKIQDDAFNLFQAGLREYLGSYGVKTQGSHYNGWGVTALSVSASKIVPTLSGTCSITKYFHGQDASDSSLKQLPDTFAGNIALLSPSGSESYSELNPTEPQVKFPSEEVRMKLSVAGLGQQEDQSCSSIQQASCSFTPEVSPFSCSGSESFSGLNQSKQQRDQVHSDDSRIKPIMTNLKQQEQKRNALKDKGTSSILNFFKSQNPSCSSWKQEHVETSQNAKATVGDCCSKLIQVQEPIESFLPETATNSGRSSSDQIRQTSEAWNYRIEEIDPTVIDELPPQIQDEIRAWLRPHKRPNIVKRGSSIADYFLPSKNR